MRKDGKAQIFWRACLIPGMILSSVRHTGLGTGGRVGGPGELGEVQEQEFSCTKSRVLFLWQRTHPEPCCTWSRRGTALPVPCSREVTPPAVPVTP